MENYLYAGARIRTLENALIGRERLGQLLACETTGEMLSRLSEYGVTVVRDPETGAFQREETLGRRLSAAYAEVLSSAPDAPFVRIRLAPFDCNNIKAAIKCRKRGIDCDRMLIPIEGCIPAATVKTAVEKGAFELLPEPFAGGAREASEQFARSGDPQCVDRILDRACFAEMLRLANACGVELALKLVKRQIDLTNIMTCVRAIRMGGGEMGQRVLESFFLPGGTISDAQLLEWYRAGEDTLWERLHYTSCESFAKAAEETDRSLTALGTASDNDLMRLAKEAKSFPIGPEILVGYLIACEYEVKNLRILFAGKSVGLSAQTLRERMRESYV